jgi:hypothetical protein
MIVIVRLLEFYDPARALLGRTISKEQVLRAKPRDGIPGASGRSALRYHLGRIRYFYDRFVEGAPVDPIELDNDCNHGCMYGPIVTDGHHRLLGAMFAGRMKIKAGYSGRVDILRYLTGRRKTSPLI